MELGPTIGEALAGLEAAIRRGDPRSHAALRPGAQDAALRIVAQACGGEAPADLASLFLWHDGQERGGSIYPEVAWRLASAQESVSERELIAPYVSRPDLGTQWLPIGLDESSNYLMYVPLGDGTGLVGHWYHDARDDEGGLIDLAQWAESTAGQWDLYAARSGQPGLIAAPLLRVGRTSQGWVECELHRSFQGRLAEVLAAMPSGASLMILGENDPVYRMTIRRADRPAARVERTHAFLDITADLARAMRTDLAAADKAACGWAALDPIRIRLMDQ